MADVEGKKLTELRVIDLKTELERRSLDKTGNKATLFERLSKAIIDEGHNPDEYLIVPFGGLPCKNSPRKNSGVQSLDDFMDISDNQQEDNMPAEGNIEVKLKVEEDLTNQETLISYKPEESQSDDYNVSENIKISKASVTQDPEVPNEVPDTSSNRPDISTCHQIVSIEASNQPHISETNGIDNEDSINLTIGEDEENLLVEETESHDKSKDGGGEKKLQENKKGDSKGSSKAESGVGGKEGMVSGANNVGIKNKQEGGDGSKSSESTNKNLKREEKERKSSHICPVNASSRNLWVSGLSSTTRATDLKQIFSKYGKVIGAKVVTNARTPGARCYGYVTMSTSEDAGKCIQHLHRTELHGRVISVEKPMVSSSPFLFDFGSLNRWFILFGHSCDFEYILNNFKYLSIYKVKKVHAVAEI
ncbi:SAFB-like transcription modulator [Prorops nasuta]|uniref:SAFB-like transcription modulator n=1 Tax=Prorops nasuta TaxID=863751 RepID=UPI0034CD9A3A